jgi:thiol-disulfide isomerase/thioredoxin
MLANTATVAACVAVIFVIARGRTGVASSAANREVNAGYSPGDAFAETSQIKFDASARTVVLFLSPHCGFCDKSMAFYKTLAERRTSKSTSFRLVAISREDSAAITEYLRRNGVEVDQVVAVSSASARIRGTPTLLVVDRHARVQRMWRGLLPKEGEQEVLKLLEGA